MDEKTVRAWVRDELRQGRQEVNPDVLRAKTLRLLIACVTAVLLAICVVEAVAPPAPPKPPAPPERSVWEQCAAACAPRGMKSYKHGAIDNPAMCTCRDDVPADGGAP